MFHKMIKNQDEIDATCAVDKHTKISAEIRISADVQKSKYRSVSSLTLKASMVLDYIERNKKKGLRHSRL